MLTLEGKKGSKTFFRVLERQNMQIQICELHTDDNKSKYSKDILKSAKKKWKTLHQANFHSWIPEFLSKIPKIKKISNERFNLS